jgi:hypothetical protein
MRENMELSYKTMAHHTDILKRTGQSTTPTLYKVLLTKGWVLTQLSEYGLRKTV